jgi:tripartite ATP-independent transporter DctM subunit
MITANIALLGSFALLLCLGVPIAVALGLAGVIGIIGGLDVYALATIGTNTYNGIAKYPLIAVPLFILTGMIFERSGVAAKLVRFAGALVGPRRGGLAIVAVLVCMLMGGMSGSGPADAAAVATVMIPSMAKAGYPRAFSAGVIAASASTAILIPPSIALIIYSIMVPGMDLRALFAAGLVPGLLAGLAIAVPTVVLSRRHDFGALEDKARPPFWSSLMGAIPGLLAPGIILGGLRSGLFTPTEAAVVAVFYGLFVGVAVYRTMGWRDVYVVLAESAKTSAVIMVIISLAGIFAWAGSTLGAFDMAAAALFTLSDNGYVIMTIVMVVLLLAGMVLDGISIYLIFLPLLIPVMTAFAWNPTWFGVLMAMNIAIGQFTPPVAVNLMVSTQIGGVTMESSVRWVIWFVLAMTLAMVLVILVPGIALWLPEALGYATT